MTGHCGMRNAERGIAAVVAVAWGATVGAADIVGTATADRPAVRLSESVRVTLTVDGPAPLRVELPPEIIDDSSAEAWRVRPTGAPTVTDSPGGRQRWSQVFRADPYRPGDPLRLAFAPAQVSEGPIKFPPVDVTVTTEVTDPSSAGIRPITGIEELPLPEAVPSRISWPGVAGVGAAILALRGWVRWRRRISTTSVEDQARRDLADAAARLAEGDDPAAVADRVAETVRQLIAQRSGLPARSRTTDELLTDGNWPAEVGAVLAVCDRVRFTGYSARADELSAAIGPVADWVSSPR